MERGRSVSIAHFNLDYVSNGNIYLDIDVSRLRID